MSFEVALAVPTVAFGELLAGFLVGLIKPWVAFSLRKTSIQSLTNCPATARISRLV